jgi:predicted phage-related endonuclease
VSLTKRQLEIRRSGITASDIRAIVGVDPYGRGPHDVWTDKVIGPANDDAETEYQNIGSELEPLAIRLTAAKRKLHVLRRDPQSLTVRHRERSAHVATPDAFLAETALHDPVALCEAKIVGFYNAHDWGHADDEIPDWCLVQVTWQSYVTEIPVVIVGALIGTECRTYRIERDDELTGVLVEAADRFIVDHITPKRPPTVDGSAGSGRMLRALFPRATGPMVRATDEIEAVAKEYFEAKRARDDAEVRLEEQKQLLMTACAEFEGLTGDGWRLRRGVRKAYTLPALEARIVPEGRTFDLRATKASRKGQTA